MSGVVPERLADGLERFGGSDAERRAVARAARDLADEGLYEADTGDALSTTFLLDQLAEPRDGEPADRWNWWIGSLAVAYGDAYSEFAVRRWEA